MISHSLKVSPAGHFVNHQQDPFGNWLARFVFPEPVTEFKIEVDLVADMTIFYNPFDFFVEDYAEYWPFLLWQRPDRRSGGLPQAGPGRAGACGNLPCDGTQKARVRTTDFVVMLNAMVSGKVRYTIRMEAGVQTPEETLTVGSGSCRDSSLASGAGPARISALPRGSSPAI